MTAELVSVIVPVLNGAEFLAECLESLVAQDHPHLEIVVIDDGSEDDSAVIAGRFARTRVLRRAHEGLGAARNAGVAACRGAFVGFCDADDTWHADKASVQVAYLETHPAVDVVLCRQETVFEDGADRPSWLLPDQLRGDLDGVSPTSGLFRRHVLDGIGGFRTDMSIGTDFNLLIRCRTAGYEIALIEQPLRVRRIHGDNMTTRTGPAKAQMFESVREHLRRTRS